MPEKKVDPIADAENKLKDATDINTALQVEIDFLEQVQLELKRDAEDEEIKKIHHKLKNGGS